MSICFAICLCLALTACLPSGSRTRRRERQRSFIKEKSELKLALEQHSQQSSSVTWANDPPQQQYTHPPRHSLPTPLVQVSSPDASPLSPQRVPPIYPTYTEENTNSSEPDGLPDELPPYLYTRTSRSIHNGHHTNDENGRFYPSQNSNDTRPGRRRGFGLSHIQSHSENMSLSKFLSSQEKQSSEAKDNLLTNIPSSTNNYSNNIESNVMTNSRNAVRENVVTDSYSTDLTPSTIVTSIPSTNNLTVNTPSTSTLATDSPSDYKSIQHYHTQERDNSSSRGSSLNSSSSFTEIQEQIKQQLPFANYQSRLSASSIDNKSFDTSFGKRNSLGK